MEGTFPPIEFLNDVPQKHCYKQGGLSFKRGRGWMKRVDHGIPVINNIKQRYDELFAAEKKVADYILNNMQEVIMLNISELALRSGVSEATVVRMCKHLGYDGYFQMRLLLSRDAGKYKPTTAGKELLTTSQQIFAHASERVSYLSELINIETLLLAANILIKARNIHIVGVGNTVPIVLDLGFRLERNGLRCTYSMLPEHYFNHISLGNDEDVVVAISRSGSSRQVIRAVELAHKKAMKTIIITGELNKQLIDKSDCVIQVSEKEGSEFLMEKPDSHLLEMAVNDALIYVIQNFNAVTDDYKNKDSRTTTNEVDLLLSEYKL